MSKAYGIEEEVAIIRRALRRNHKYKKGDLYRGFNGARIGVVLEHGTDVPGRGFTYASTEQELLEEEGDGAIRFAGDYPKKALLVYDGELMRESNKGSDFDYEFLPGVKPQNALRAILVLNYDRKR